MGSIQYQLSAYHEVFDISCCSHRCCRGCKCIGSSTTSRSSTTTSSSTTTCSPISYTTSPLPTKTASIRLPSSLWTTKTWRRIERPSPTLIAGQEWWYRDRLSPSSAVAEWWTRWKRWEEGRIWWKFSAAPPASWEELQGCSRLCQAQHWHNPVRKGIIS